MQKNRRKWKKRKQKKKKKKCLSCKVKINKKQVKEKKL